MKTSDFLIATGSLIISTRYNLSQTHELLDTWNLPSFITHDTSIGTTLATLSNNSSQASELATVISNFISVGLLAMIYDVGRYEKLHAPMVVLAFAASVIFWNEFTVPIDIYLFVVFPWMLMIGLLLSRMHGMMWEVEGRSMLEKTSSACVSNLVQEL